MVYKSILYLYIYLSANWLLFYLVEGPLEYTKTEDQVTRYLRTLTAWKTAITSRVKMFSRPSVRQLRIYEVRSADPIFDDSLKKFKFLEEGYSITLEQVERATVHAEASLMALKYNPENLVLADIKKVFIVRISSASIERVN